MYTFDEKQKIDALKEKDPETYLLLDTMRLELKEALHNGCHDIQNVLALISGNVQLLEHSHPEIKTSVYFESLKSDIKYLIRMLSAISKFRNSATSNKSKFNPVISIKKIIASYPVKTELNSRNLPTIVNADRDGLEFIVTSILENIAECDENACASVSLSVDNGFLKIVIKDNLPELPKEASDNFFKPFYTTKQDHFGLGLPTAYRIAVTNNGYLKYEYNGGNIFTATIQI